MTGAPLPRLRQVQGVLGSFTCAASGELLLLDMPERFTLPSLESTAARLINLFQTADEVIPRCRGLSLGFGEHLLLSRRYDFGILCVLTTRDPDRPLLSITTRLLARRLSALRVDPPTDELTAR
jgi:hypothetical protein